MNKTTAYALAGVAVIVVAAVAIYASNRKNNNPGTLPATGLQQTPDQNSQASATPIAAPAPKPAPRLNYGEALKAYPYRFQFSQCHGLPGSMVVKKGSIVMLDNRDPKAHTIKADGQTFRVNAYDFALLHTSLISNSFVTCDGGGAAMLNVEK